MTDTKHTPGPWAVHCDPCHYDTASDVKSDCGKLFASVGGKAQWQEQEANARLISAAPDMLAALIAAENYIANTESEFGFTLKCGESARAALAKARGQA